MDDFWTSLHSSSERNTITFLRRRKILSFGQAVANSKMRELVKSFHKSICIVLGQLWLFSKISQNQRLVIHGSGKVPICVQSRLFGRLTELWVEGSFMALDKDRFLPPEQLSERFRKSGKGWRVMEPATK